MLEILTADKRYGIDYCQPLYEKEVKRMAENKATVSKGVSAGKSGWIDISYPLS